MEKLSQDSEKWGSNPGGTHADRQWGGSRVCIQLPAILTDVFQYFLQFYQTFWRNVFSAKALTVIFSISFTGRVIGKGHHLSDETDKYPAWGNLYSLCLLCRLLTCVFSFSLFTLLSTYLQYFFCVCVAIIIKYRQLHTFYYNEIKWSETKYGNIVPNTFVHLSKTPSSLYVKEIIFNLVQYILFTYVFCF